MIESILIFLCMIGVLIISHEGGHYLIARANGIRVVEFTVGVGPAIVKKKKGDTLFALRALPFGGACIFDGMYEDEGEENFNDEHTFRNANVWARIATLFAGPFFNFLLGFVLSLFVTAFSAWLYPVVIGITDNSAAEAAGIEEGDRILSMNGKRVHMAGEVTLMSQLNRGEDITLVIERDGGERTITFTPNYSDEDARYYMGLYVGKKGSVPLAQLVPYAWYTEKYYFDLTFTSLKMLIHGELTLDNLSGPVGMVKMVDETYEEVRPFGLPAVALTMLDLAILLTVNLGVLNLLPIPALDGGRLLFAFIEVLRGKPIPPEKEGYVHLAGMIALIALMIVVLFNDIGKFIG
ncbi:MAG: site-2 protease family protein [Lachnospiraceae bacterium]|nr:site-2 protease family protein [Lachnospiraceae bacterium]